MSFDIEGSDLCAAKGCRKPRERNRPYCSMHRKRLKRYGSLSHPLDCRVEGCWKKRAVAKRVNGKTYYRPYCWMHTNRLRKWGVLHKKDRTRVGEIEYVEGGRVVYHGNIEPTPDETLCHRCGVRKRRVYKTGPRAGRYVDKLCKKCHTDDVRAKYETTRRTVARCDGGCCALNTTRRGRDAVCRRTARPGKRTCHIHADWEHAPVVASLVTPTNADEGGPDRAA